MTSKPNIEAFWEVKSISVYDYWLAIIYSRQDKSVLVVSAKAQNNNEWNKNDSSFYKKERVKRNVNMLQIDYYLFFNNK